MAECVLQYPLFAGSTMIQQLSEIMKVLGTPTKQDAYAMNKHYSGFKARDSTCKLHVVYCSYNSSSCFQNRCHG